jgi:hypothetical protein
VRPTELQTLAFELRPSMLDEFGQAGALRMLVARHLSARACALEIEAPSLPLPAFRSPRMCPSICNSTPPSNESREWPTP